jgi:hypothetical protein
MFRRLLRPPIWKLAVWVAIAGFLTVWWWNRPLASLTLADGTKIFLRRVSYGTEHEIEEPLGSGATTLERIRHVLFRPKTKRRSSEYPAYVFFFSKKNPGELAERGAPIDELEVLLDDGRWSPASTTQAREFTLWNDATFPRREKAISIRIKVADKWYHWQLPNPAVGQDFPTWPIQSFPQTREVGDFKVIANGWTKRGDEWCLDYDLHYRGRAIGNGYDTATVEEWDATGNYTMARVQGLPYRNAWLSSRENPWKVKLTLTAGLDKPLSADHVVSFGKARVPKAGEYTILEMPTGIGEKGDYFAALLGPGHFGFRNGEFFLPRFGKGLRAYDSCVLNWYPDSWKITAVRDNPGFILVNLTKGEKKQWPGRDVVFRFLDGEKPGKINNYSGFSGACISCSLLKPPPSKEIEIQALRFEEVSVEFLLPPPRVEE